MARYLKSKIAIIVLVGLCLIVAFTGIVSAFTPTVVDTAFMYAWSNRDTQWTIWYASGRWWIFGFDWTPQNYIYYSSADDGATWSAKATLRGGIDGGNIQHNNVGIWCTDNSVTYTWSDSTAAGNPVVYRKGTLVSDGSISWLAAEQTAIAGIGGNKFYKPRPFVTSDNVPWIAVWNSLSAAMYAFSSTTDNGTWTAGTSDYIEGCPNFYSNPVAPVVLNGSTFYLMWETYATGRIYGSLWDGADFSTIETIMNTSNATETWSATGNPTDNTVTMVYQSVATKVNYIMSRTPATGTWSGVTDLSLGVAGITPYNVPKIASLYNGNLIVVEEEETGGVNGKILYKNRIDGIWDSVWATMAIDNNISSSGFAMVRTNGADSHFAVGYIVTSTSKTKFFRFDNPTCTTMTAYPIAVVSATLNGQVGTLYGTTETPEYRFQYGPTSAYETENTTWTPYVGTTCSYNITAVAGSHVHFRTQIRTSFGIGSGTDKNFTLCTTASAPTNASATALSGTSISVSWILTSCANEALIRYDTTDYPADRFSGTLAYLGTGTGHIESGLLPGTTYFFRLWGYILDGSEYYSATYVDCMITTPAGSGTDEFTGPVDTNPLLPDETTLSGMPGYYESGWLASIFHMEWGFFLRFVFMMIGAIICAGIAAETDSVLIVIVAMIATYALMFTIGLIPWWILPVFAFPAIAISYIKEAR